jgi:sugar (pentulose or hexulose) kinase
VAGAIAKFLRATGQRADRFLLATASLRPGAARKEAPPRGAMFRMLLESLALSYRAALDELSALTGNRFRRLCAVGGGTRNEMLCQFIADATGLEVMAGPAEATVMGNLAVQALACGHLDSPKQVRDLVRNSSVIKSYKPQNSETWRREFDRYMAVTERTKEL